MSKPGGVLQGLARSYWQARHLAAVARNRWFADSQEAFERISVERAWDYTTQLEAERHERVLAGVSALRGDGSWGRALEVGCYNGTFTQQLAQRCSAVMACDISPDACTRTRSRCAGLPQVQVAHLNLESDTIAGTYDLVFVMDVLNYVYGRDKMLRVSSKLAAAIANHGLLVITDCRMPPHIRDAWFSHWVPVGGDNITRLFANQPEWQLLRTEFHPDSGEDAGPHYMAHVIAFFERRAPEGV